MRQMEKYIGHPVTTSKGISGWERLTLGKTGHKTTDWLQIRKGVCQGCISSPYLFNLYAEYIM